MNKNRESITELEYALLFSDSDFIVSLARNVKKKSKNISYQKFCLQTIKAINKERKKMFQDAFDIWNKIYKSTTFSKTIKIIAEGKTVELQHKLKRISTKESEKKIKLLLKKLNDDLSKLILESTKTKSSQKKLLLYEQIGVQLKKNCYFALADFIDAWKTPHVKYSSKEEEINAHRNSSRTFKKLGAKDLFHISMGKCHLMQINDEMPNEAISLSLQSANQFKLGNDEKLYHIAMWGYFSRLAKKEKNLKKQSDFYKQAASHISEADFKKDYFTSMGNYHYSRSHLEKQKHKQIAEIEKAKEFFKKSSNTKLYSKMNGVKYLLSGNNTNLSTAAYNYKIAARWFKKSGSASMYNEMMGLHYKALSGTTSDIMQQIKFLKSSSKYYKLTKPERCHFVDAQRYYLQTNLTKNIAEKADLLKLAAQEYLAAKLNQGYYACLGYHFFYLALTKKEPNQINLLIKSAKTLQKINHPLQYEAIGMVFLSLAIVSRSEKDAEQAEIFFKKVNDDAKAALSRLLYYEIKAENELGEERKCIFYNKAAVNLKQFLENKKTKLTGSIPGLAREYQIPNIDEKMFAKYEYYMGLGSKGNQKEDNLYKSKTRYQTILEKEPNDRITLHEYGLVLRALKEYDESHSIFTKLVTLFPNRNSIKSECELSEKLLKADYKKTKYDLEQEKFARKELMRENAKTLSYFNKLELPSEESFLDKIIGVISTVGIDLQTKPSTCSKLNEEQIRDIFHNALNVKFDGCATRESRRVHGPTDILVTNPASTSEIIVCEFKFWKGEKYFHKGIDQILDYSTITDKEAIFVTLNKHNDWKSITEKTKAAAKSHTHYTKDSFKPAIAGTLDSIFWTDYITNNRNKPIRICNILFDIAERKRLTRK